jgi:hypothetical protein
VKQAPKSVRARTQLARIIEVGERSSPRPPRARRSVVDRSPCKGEAAGSIPAASIHRWPRLVRNAPALLTPPRPLELDCSLISCSKLVHRTRSHSNPNCSCRELLGIGLGHKTLFDGRPDDGRLHTQPGRKLSYTSRRLLRRMEDGSAQAPTKVVPSCDMPRVDARSL